MFNVTQMKMNRSTQILKGGRRRVQLECSVFSDSLINLANYLLTECLGLKITHSPPFIQLLSVKRRAASEWAPLEWFRGMSHALFMIWTANLFSDLNKREAHAAAHPECLVLGVVNVRLLMWRLIDRCLMRDASYEPVTFRWRVEIVFFKKG